MAKILTNEDLEKIKDTGRQVFQPSGNFFAPDDKITSLLPDDLAQNWGMAVIGSADQNVTIAIDDLANPYQNQVIKMIGERGWGVVFYPTTSDALNNLIRLVHSGEQVPLEPTS